MDLDLIAPLFSKLVAQHVPADYVLNFKFCNRSAALGVCTHHAPFCATIQISKKWARVMPIETITNTLLHEIAHALVGVGNGHNEKWRRQFIALGGNGESCTRVSTEDCQKIAKYLLICVNDDFTMGKVAKTYTRKPSKNMSGYGMGSCNHLVYIPANDYAENKPLPSTYFQGTK